MVLFHSVAHHGRGLSQYLQKVEDPEPATLAVLARVLWDACSEFHYGYLDRMSEAEHELRWAVRSIHHQAEQHSVDVVLGVAEPRSNFIDPHWLYGALGRTTAEQNPLFAELTESERASILEGRRARSRALPVRTSPFGVDPAVASAIYKLLSNCVHSTALGTFIARTPGSPTLGGALVVRLSLAASCHSLSWTVLELVKRRLTLKRLLSDRDLAALRANARPSFWQNLRTSPEVGA